MFFRKKRAVLAVQEEELDKRYIIYEDALQELLGTLHELKVDNVYGNYFQGATDYLLGIAATLPDNQRLASIANNFYILSRLMNSVRIEYKRKDEDWDDAAELLAQQGLDTDT